MDRLLVFEREVSSVRTSGVWRREGIDRTRGPHLHHCPPTPFAQFYLKNRDVPVPDPDRVRESRLLRVDNRLTTMKNKVYILKLRCIHVLTLNEVTTKVCTTVF